MRGGFVPSNYQIVETKKPTGLFIAESLAAVIGSFSSLDGLLARSGPMQRALADIMVLATGFAIFFVGKRFQKHHL
ncbi:hypothetical protein BAR153v2_000970 [Bartonella sp. AR 15-3]